MQSSEMLVQERKARSRPEAKQRDWQAVVSELPDVQKLVHLAMRLDDFDVDRFRGELLKARRRAYEDELTIQARRVGCGSRSGLLGNNQSLSALNDDSQADAESIVATYNFDLAAAIANIATETPTANRYTYAKRLGEWEEKRNGWKAGQIAQYTEGTARSKAQADFYALNNIDGVAVLKPETAAEPICQGWIDRGEVPLREALNNPGPFHMNCPHLWVTKPGKVAAGECADLWMGG